MQSEFSTALPNGNIHKHNVSQPKSNSTTFTPTKPTTIANISTSGDKYALEDKGVSLYNLGNYTQAIQYADKALAIDPNDKLALQDKGADLDSIGNDPEAIKYYDKALAIDPNDEFALQSKAVALANLHDYSQAIQYDDKLLAMNPHDTFASESKYMATLKMRIIKYHNALTINPRDKNTLDLLAADLLTYGNWTGALKYANEALALDIHDTYASNTKALALNAIKQSHLPSNIIVR